MRFLVLLALTGCESVHSRNLPPCVSKCGMLLEDQANGSMSCDVLQEAEDKFLAAADELKDKDARLSSENACKAIFGWQLRLEQSVVGSTNGSDFYVGLSNCYSKEMTLFANKDWRSGSYIHEMFHLAQDCKPPESWDEDPLEAPQRGPGHAGWETNGVDSIIREFRRGYR